MRITKRSGAETDFDIQKIVNAISKANGEADQYSRLTKDEIEGIAHDVMSKCVRLNRIVNVEEIQDMVENGLMDSGHHDVARKYITYRYDRSENREMSDFEKRVMAIADNKSEAQKQENANKNVTVEAIKRDAFAGAVSRELTERVILPKEIVEAHRAGIIHFHDSDYFLGHIHNCELINLDDMLQNGTVINGVTIERPDTFSTACTIATQIILQVSSNSYGGATISLAHLVPFVASTRKRFTERIIRENEKEHLGLTDEQIKKLAEEYTRQDIHKGLNTIVFQSITFLSGNGQAAFLSEFMYLNEVPEEQRDDMAYLIEQTLKLRYDGVKDPEGNWINPTFPKLLYVLQDDNIHPGDKYYYLTELAVKCSAKQMVPDYISEKVMLENKIDANGEGHCYPCMGCVDKDEVVTYRYNSRLYVESFIRFWDRMSDLFEVKTQANGRDLYIDLPDGVEIYDMKNGFVACRRIIRNATDTWYRIKMSNGRLLTCTGDHPFPTQRGRVLAADLELGDKIGITHTQYSDETKTVDDDLAWAYGVILCDGAISSNVIASFAMTGEDDIIDALATTVNKHFGVDYKVQEQHRGPKGDYKDLKFYKTEDLKYSLIRMFEGISKARRHVPNEVFSWNRSAKLSFLAGMIDADGHISDSGRLSHVQLGSTNKELAYQQMLLAQSLDMPASIYENAYNKSSNNIRYRVEFVPSDELMEHIVCEKKRSSLVSNERKNASCIDNDFGEVTDIMVLEQDGYSYDVTTDSDHFDVSGIYSHNCRSFLTPYVDENGMSKYYGRFNQGVVTISLPDVALSSHKDMDEFWKIFEERLELCYRALMCRHHRLEGTLSDAAPILWQYGALARLKSGEKIDKLLHGGYSTISLGYAGLYECVKYMTGKSHTDEEGFEFATQVMQKMNDKCAEWKARENIDFSVYGTPIESTTYKFAKCLQKRFGVIDGITDHNYITNSYHVSVTEPISAFDKISLEAQLQPLSPGGCISYVELPNMTNNLEAVMSVVQWMYEKCMYCELNLRTQDHCKECGYTGEIRLIDEGGDFHWECPKCGNRDPKRMTVIRRICGYLANVENGVNDGRLGDIHDRVLHL